MARLVAGLGNPGARYEGTRHNMGFMVVSRAARDLGLRLKPYGKLGRWAEWSGRGVRGYLIEPLNYMNRSGRAVGDLAVRKGIDAENILVVSDEFNLPLGKLRFRARGSAGGHNGLSSVIHALGTDEFPRLRCGIGALTESEDGAEASGASEIRENSSDYVLSTFRPDEEEAVAAAVARAAEGVRLWLETGDLELCQNRFN
jgi:PTH1 family peptidyl-tRNA hydrolase